MKKVATINTSQLKRMKALADNNDTVYHIPVEGVKYTSKADDRSQDTGQVKAIAGPIHNHNFSTNTWYPHGIDQSTVRNAVLSTRNGIIYSSRDRKVEDAEFFKDYLRSDCPMHNLPSLGDF